jgi:diguanylate cyclase (GGDEF)-like protein
VVVHRDITARKRSEEDMARRATHDQLTGLLNRAGLEEGVESVLELARSSQVPIAALFVDLDNFKEINDTFGHSIGDAVLRVVAQRITGSVRASDLVARLGGDEFVILLLDPLHEGGSATATAERILESMEGPMRAAGIELDVRASIGVVVVADAADVSPAGLLQRADDAMYVAKRHGGARYSLVDG